MCSVPLEAVERALPEQPFGSYVSVLDIGKKVGSTHVAFGFLMGFVSFHFGLTTVSSCFLIWLETVRDIT